MIGVVEERREQRDAIVMSVDAANRWALVKIQGSNTQIRAWFPLNWGSNPSWLKAGNAVRISTPGGNKGRIEILGHGILLPTAVSGGSVTPPAPTLEDVVLTGLGLSATIPTATMTVVVAPGTYRIDEVVYSLIGIPMGNAMPMGTSIGMGGYGAMLTIDDDAGLFRYDLVVAGTDGVAEVVKGTGAASDPVMPATPADHVLLGWILVYPNMTAVNNSDLNRVYSDPEAANIIISASPTTLHGMSVANPHMDLTSTISISVVDQYGNPSPRATPGHAVQFLFLSGNGDLVCGSTSFDESSGTQTFYTTSGLLSMTYTRQGTAPGGVYQGNGESSPIFQVQTTIITPVYALQNLSLLDSSDDLVI
jgi:hypothetical protein